MNKLTIIGAAAGGAIFLAAVSILAVSIVTVGYMARQKREKIPHGDHSLRQRSPETQGTPPYVKAQRNLANQDSRRSTLNDSVESSVLCEYRDHHCKS